MCKEWHKGRPRCFVSHWKFYNCIRVFINELLLHREQKMHFTVKIKTLPVRCLFQWKQSCVICFDVWRAWVCDHLEMNRRFRSQLDNVRCLNSWCSALGFSLCCMSCRLFPEMRLVANTWQILYGLLMESERTYETLLYCIDLFSLCTNLICCRVKWPCTQSQRHNNINGIS